MTGLLNKMQTPPAKGSTLPYHEMIHSPKAFDSSDFSRIRSVAFERFKELGFPTRKNEAWKYIYLDTILNSVYSEISEDFITIQTPEKLKATVFDLSDAFGSLDPLLKTWLREAVLNETNAFSLINAFRLSKAHWIRIPKDSKNPQPIQISLSKLETTQGSVAFYPRIAVILEEGAEAEMIFDQSSGVSQSYFMNAVIDIYQAKNSKFQLTLVQKENAHAVSFLKTSVHLEDESEFKMLSFTHGGLTTRQETQIYFCGERAVCDVRSLAIQTGASRFYQHVTAHHEKGNSHSNQLFKTILAGEAQAEINSMVSVVRDAQKSESKQLNRNLLLSDQARVYSRPQLKIYADDVKCGHGAATGQLDESELFYLRSRGISKDQARLMMTLAFAEEVIQAFKSPEIRESIETLTKNELDQIVC